MGGPAPSPNRPPTTPPPLGPCGQKGVDTTPWQSRNGVGGLIVNGQQATECEWRWQASLRRGTFSFCGGSLIHPKWVMSAAHCVVSATPSSVTIVLGDHDKDNVGSNESSMSVSRIINHPSYNSGNMQYDFALIELQNRAPENQCIGTVCIPQIGDSDINEVDCFITGWGTLSSGGSAPRFLQEAKVRTVTNANCNTKYPNQIHDSMLCAQGRNSNGAVTDACQGDSGGPLVCERSGKFYLEGATSWGLGCAHADYPGVWARLSQVTAWTNTYVPAVPVGPPGPPNPSPGPAPSPMPTPGPAPSPMPTPGLCKPWCSTDSRPFSAKCKWDKCAGCSECQVNSGQCKAWCAAHTNNWSKKCLWEKCSGCPDCTNGARRLHSRRGIGEFLSDDELFV